MQYIVIYIAIVVFGSAYSEYTSAPQKYLNFAAVLILIYLLQKCLKNLPILITNYIPFEKCTIRYPQF